MSEKIDPREVLAYLNQLGYTNITAQQLKEFIIDLKKLLKYDSRYGVPEKTNREQSYCPEESEYCECESSKDENDTTNDHDKENQPKMGYQKEPKKIDVPLSKVGQKDKHIAVHIYDTKTSKNIPHEHCVHIDKLQTADTDTDRDKQKFVSSRGTSGTSKAETTESTIRSIHPSSTRECQSRASSKERKSRVAFIRPGIARPSFNKCDPVALYHYYQSEWKRTKIPGQDSRDDLRWAIRERMLSGPRVEVKSKCNVQRCGWR